jgi:hypothetical protein
LPAFLFAVLLRFALAATDRRGLLLAPWVAEERLREVAPEVLLFAAFFATALLLFLERPDDDFDFPFAAFFSRKSFLQSACAAQAHL